MSGPTRAELLAEREEMRAEVEGLHKGLEQTYSNYTLLARQLEDLQYIDVSGYGTAMQDDVLPRAKAAEVITRIRRLRHENPIAKQAIKLTLRFVFGKGVTYSVKDTRYKKAIDAFWNDSTNQALLTSRNSMRQRLDDKLTDGETFMVMVTAPVEPFVRLARLPMEEVHEILYHPENAEVPVWYKRVYRARKYEANLNDGQGGWVVDSTSKPFVRYYRDYRISDRALVDIEEAGLAIPENLTGEGFVLHSMVNPMRMKTGWRGISELFASREWFRVFKEFMEDRGAINAAANALSFRRKIKGGPTAVASFSNRLGGVPVAPAQSQSFTADAISRLTRPMAGAVYDHNEGVDLEGQRVDTGAAHAERDARMILMAGAAGTGTAITYFGEGSSSLASAQVMELPMVKGYEDYQTDQADEFTEIVKFVLRQAFGENEDLTSDAIVAWHFPPIITQDVVKWMSAYAQWAQQIAPGNNEVRRLAIMGAMNALNVPNAAQMVDAIEAEEKRIADDKEAERKVRLDQQQRNVNAPQGGAGALTGGSSNGNNGDGNGQRAGGGPMPSALGPNLTRLRAGRPPAEAPTGPRTRR